MVYRGVSTLRRRSSLTEALAAIKKLRVANEFLLQSCEVSSHTSTVRTAWIWQTVFPLSGAAVAAQRYSIGRGRPSLGPDMVACRFVFRGRRGDRIKVLWWDGDGLCLFAKRLERGRFVWPQATSGTVAVSGAQLSMLLEGIDWRRPKRTFDPQLAV
jgi:transposase